MNWCTHLDFGTSRVGQTGASCVRLRALKSYFPQGFLCPNLVGQHHDRDGVQLFKVRFSSFFPFDLCDQVRSEQDWPPGGNVWHLLCHALWSNIICKGGLKRKYQLKFLDLEINQREKFNGWIFSLGERRRSFPVTRMTSVNWVKGKQWSWMILETKWIEWQNKNHRKGFSDTDIRKLNTLYNCKGYPQVSPCNHYKGIVSPSNGNKSLDRWEAQDP